jgi:hypothetical protein
MSIVDNQLIVYNSKYEIEATLSPGDGGSVVNLELVPKTSLSTLVMKYTIPSTYAK